MATTIRIPKGQDLRWWRADKGAVALALWSYRFRIAERQKDQERRFLTNARLYGNMNIIGLRPATYSLRMDDDRMRLNVVQSVIDTAASKIASTRPAPQFLTSGADYDLRRKAEKLNKFGKGLLHASDFYKIAPQLFRDGAIFGTGIGKIFTQDKRIRCERVYPWEIYLDHQESFYGAPRTLVQRKFIDRDVLLDVYGSGRTKARDAILAASVAPESDIGRDPLCDQVEVLEAWHLPTGPDAGDGRHVIALNDYPLLDEEWTRDRLPFVFYRWDEPVTGFWGRGAAEMLAPIQYEINVLLQKIQRAFHLLGVPRVFIDAGSGVPKAHVTNDIGAIIQVNPGASPPQVVAPATVNPEIFNHLNWLVQRAYEQVGVSEMSAASRKPAGLDSGAALREFDDIESGRFVLPARRYEDLHLDAVRVGLDEAREIRGFSVDVPDKNAKIEVRWADVSLDDSAYVLQCFPSSLLPQQPAGRLQRVSEMIASGMLTKEQGVELLEAPDMEDMGNALTAFRKRVRMALASMLDGGAYVPPEPFFDLATCVEMARSTYLEEQIRGCPEDRLELLRRFIEESMALMGPPPGAAPGGPQAPPVAGAPPQQMTPPQQMAA